MRRRDDDGAAVPEFVMVSVLVMLLFMIVFQVGLALHTRNVLVSVAAEGARYGANADVDATGPAVRQRVVEGISTAFSPAYAGRAQIGQEVVGGVVEVRITAPFPLAFVPDGIGDLSVAGHALKEGQ